MRNFSMLSQCHDKTVMTLEFGVAVHLHEVARSWCVFVMDCLCMLKHAYQAGVGRQL
jgi:hypothetical protein